jgi:hypothetical protein
MVLNDITNDSAVTRGRLGTSTLSNTDTNFAKKKVTQIRREHPDS